MQPDVSILISTRPMRPGIVVECLQIALDKAHDKTLPNVEFMIKIDHDDKATLEAVKNLQPTMPIRYIIMDGVGRRGNLVNYTNTLAWNSTGKLLWYWSDEIRMETDNWDIHIKPYADRYTNKPLVLAPRTRNQPGYFIYAPIVTRRWLEETGRFAAHPCIDSYLDLIRGPLSQQGLMRLPEIPEISVHEIDLAHYKTIPPILTESTLTAKIIEGFLLKELLAQSACTQCTYNRLDLNQPAIISLFTRVIEKLGNILRQEGPA